MVAIRWWCWCCRQRWKKTILISFEIRYSRVQSLDSITVLCYVLSNERVFFLPRFISLSPSFHLSMFRSFFFYSLWDCCIPDKATNNANTNTKQFIAVLTFYIHTHHTHTNKCTLKFPRYTPILESCCCLCVHWIDTRILISRSHSSTFCCTNRKFHYCCHRRRRNSHSDGQIKNQSEFHLKWQRYDTIKHDTYETVRDIYPKLILNGIQNKHKKSYFLLQSFKSIFYNVEIQLLDNYYKLLGIFAALNEEISKKNLPRFREATNISNLGTDFRRRQTLNKLCTNRSEKLCQVFSHTVMSLCFSLTLVQSMIHYNLITIYFCLFVILTF